MQRRDLAEERGSTECSEFLGTIRVGLRRGQSVRRPAEVHVVVVRDGEVYVNRRC